MRCQKARSYLSAFCRDELSGRELLAVREHLAGCASCRREETVVRSMFDGAKALKTPVLSADFNAKLLNRIAQERFSETRTKAYFPRRAPIFTWPRLVPVSAVALVAVFAVVGSGYFGQMTQVATTTGGTAVSTLDSSYLTVQPNRDLSVPSRVTPDWSFRSQLAQAERSNRLSGVLTSNTGFTASEPRAVLQLMIPCVDCQLDRTGFRVRPIVRMYEPSGTNQAKEKQSVY